MQPLLGTFGNLGRNALRLNKYENVDLILLKNTKVNENLTGDGKWDSIFQSIKNGSIDPESVPADFLYRFLEFLVDAMARLEPSVQQTSRVDGTKGFRQLRK